MSSAPLAFYFHYGFLCSQTAAQAKICEVVSLNGWNRMLDDNGFGIELDKWRFVSHLSLLLLVLFQSIPILVENENGLR